VDIIRTLFDAKFSEALKTVGKRFDFVQLYNERDHFKDEILKVIGTDLNGFTLDDCAIDFLEQTAIENLDPDNILDAEGIKKITELTAAQAKLANKSSATKKRSSSSRTCRLARPCSNWNASSPRPRPSSSAMCESVSPRDGGDDEGAGGRAPESRARQDRRRRRDRRRHENKDRQVLVAQRNKERTDAVEIERVTRDRDLEIIDRERVTTLKSIEKEKPSKWSARTSRRSSRNASRWKRPSSSSSRR
jgi:flotillin